MRIRPYALFLFPLLTYAPGCGGEPEPEAACGLGAPTMTLGSGERAFERLADGDPLPLARGLQGGCHLPLSFRLSGLDGRRLEARYRIEDLTDGLEHISSRQFVRARPAPEGCEVVGFPAFVVQPWRLEDARVRVTVTLLDQSGREASDAREVLVRWPPPDPNVADADLCGPQ